MSTQNKKLSAKANVILNILSDHGWHCGIDWGYADGHGKRLTDINRYLLPLGQKLAFDWCDCGRHVARILKRKIVPLDYEISRGGPEVGHRPLGDYKAVMVELPVTIGAKNNQIGQGIYLIQSGCVREVSYRDTMADFNKFIISAYNAFFGQFFTNTERVSINIALTDIRFSFIAKPIQKDVITGMTFLGSNPELKKIVATNNTDKDFLFRMYLIIKKSSAGTIAKDFNSCIPQLFSEFRNVQNRFFTKSTKIGTIIISPNDSKLYFSSSHTDIIAECGNEIKHAGAIPAPATKPCCYSFGIFKTHSRECETQKITNPNQLF